jgi:hypothetical protein
VAGQEVTLGDAPATPTAVIRAVTTWDAYPSLWGPLLAEVWSALHGSAAATGRNVMVYCDQPGGGVAVEVGAEVGDGFEAAGRVVASALPAGEAARAVAPGTPSAPGLAAAHARIGAWCEAAGREPAGTRVEVYDHERGDGAPRGTEVYWLLR